MCAPPKAPSIVASCSAAHEAYARERDAEIVAEHAGPRPSGGVGGTRTGVKCLHAHYAFHLAGGDDPVGRWVEDRLASGAAGVMRVAAIDIGTNSTRLLVADVDGGENGSLETVERRMRITRLGQGVDGRPPAASGRDRTHGRRRCVSTAAESTSSASTARPYDRDERVA